MRMRLVPKWSGYKLIALSSVGAGTFGAILSAPVTHLGTMDDIGQRVGQYQAVVAVASLAGPPISGAIHGTAGGFIAAGAWAGKYRVNDNKIILLISHYSRYLPNFGIGDHAVGQILGLTGVEG